MELDIDGYRDDSSVSSISTGSGSVVTTISSVSAVDEERLSTSLGARGAQKTRYEKDEEGHHRKCLTPESLEASSTKDKAGTKIRSSVLPGWASFEHVLRFDDEDVNSPDKAGQGMDDGDKYKKAPPPSPPSPPSLPS